MIAKETSRYDEDYILEPIQRLQKNCRILEKRLENQKPKRNKGKSVDNTFQLYNEDVLSSQ